MIPSSDTFPFILACYALTFILCGSLALRTWLRFRSAKKQWQLWQMTQTHKTHCGEPKNSV